MNSIKELRTRKGLTQQQLADASGITLRTIQRIENGEVKPSLHSLNSINKVLDADLSDLHQEAETKPYEFNLTIKITDMNQFLNDLKTLFKRNWKIITIIVIVILLLSNYTEIKEGIIDGWTRK